MDPATIGGLVMASVLVAGGIMVNSSIMTFVDPASLLITGGGTIAAMFTSYPARRVKDSVKVAKKAFFTQPRHPDEVIKLMQSMAYRARREGVLALEEVAKDQDDEFLKRGIQMVVDGHDPAAIEEALYGEIDNIEERHKSGAEFFGHMGLLAPSFGMIGTLIGLIVMMQNLDDPSKIGPPMAVALLTTFYGAMIANIFAIPLEKKLQVRSKEELEEKLLIAQGLLSILAGENPRFLVERLNAQLAPDDRVQEAS